MVRMVERLAGCEEEQKEEEKIFLAYRYQKSCLHDLETERKETHN